MSDIVERLERMAATGIYPREVSEAAAEIERLRSQLLDPTSYATSIRERDAKIERLRSVLQSIHDVYDKSEYHNPTILGLLRRALEPKP